MLLLNSVSGEPSHLHFASSLVSTIGLKVEVSSLIPYRLVCFFFFRARAAGASELSASDPASPIWEATVRPGE
jgi:hypothetical protein